MSFAAELSGRMARQALGGGPGEVCAVFRRSFYVRRPGERYACIGDRSLGSGPLNVQVRELRLPALGSRVLVDFAGAREWRPDLPAVGGALELASLEAAAARRVPAEGLGCTIARRFNALACHAQPALDALDEWLRGASLHGDAARLVGLGPGLTPSGDDYLGGVLVALRHYGRAAQADQLWRWLAPRLAAGTSAISAAHLRAAAEGEAHETLHECLGLLSAAAPDWDAALTRLDLVGHCSGWDALAGAVAALRAAA